MSAFTPSSAKFGQGGCPGAVATGFPLIAVMLVIFAERRAAAVMRRLSPHVIVTARRVNLRLYAAVIVASSVALIAAIWLEL